MIIITIKSSIHDHHDYEKDVHVNDDRESEHQENRKKVITFKESNGIIIN